METPSGPGSLPPTPTSFPPSLVRVGPSLHPAAGWDLASVTEPGHLWPGEAGNAWRFDDSGFSVGHTLVFLAFLETPHVCREGRCRGQKVNPVSGTGQQRKGMIMKKGHLPRSVPRPIRYSQSMLSPGLHAFLDSYESSLTS